MPYVWEFPGLGKPNLTKEQIARNSQIIAEEMSCKALPNIDPLDGIVPRVFQEGINQSPMFVVELSAYYQDDRIAKGEDLPSAIADRISEVVGYHVRVWLFLERVFIEGRSDRVDHPRLSWEDDE